MRIFFAGASGVLGRRLVPLLVADGHDVTAMTRVPERAQVLAAMGARPFVCDVFDADRLVRGVLDAGPELVLHQLTDLPQRLDLRRLPEIYERNNRVRREGTRNLLLAAERVGARRMVAQSIAFGYAPTDGPVKTEDDPLFLDAPEPMGSAFRTVDEMERAIAESGIEHVILRYGFFYGPGTANSREGDVGQQVRRRRYPIIGRGDGVWSLIHIDDVATATRAALTAAEGVYNVVDDEPAPLREWLPPFADALGAPRPLRVPVLVARMAADPGAVAWIDSMRGADNRRAVEVLGWKPAYASWRQGFREGL